ncbi:MAG: hypothetical protein RRC34_04260 [Lentisphaeria bacterium]|nr:hypothetical protein [Lentisphaeria bacterium]
MKHAGIAMVTACLLIAGCGGAKKREANADEYFKNLRIHVQPVSRTAMNGVLEPQFTLVITNAGGKTIRRMKIVGDVSLGNAYADTSVKTLRQKVRKDGGQIKIDFAFVKSPKMPDAQVLLNQLKYNFTVQEIGF